VKWHNRYILLILALLAAFALYWTSLGTLQHTERIKVDRSNCIELCSPDYDKTTDALEKNRGIWQSISAGIIIFCLLSYFILAFQPNMARNYLSVLAIAIGITFLSSLIPLPLNTSPWTNTVAHDSQTAPYVLYRLDIKQGLERANDASFSTCKTTVYDVKSYGFPLTIKTSIPLGCISSGTIYYYSRIMPMAIIADVLINSIFLAAIIFIYRRLIR